MGILIKYKDLFFDCDGNQTLENDVYRGYGNSGHIQSLVGLGLVQVPSDLVYIGPALSRRLYSMRSSRYFQLFYDYDEIRGIRAESERRKKYFLILLSPLL